MVSVSLVHRRYVVASTDEFYHLIHAPGLFPSHISHDAFDHRHNSFALAGCASIGPWDCDIGAFLTIEDCCSLIKAAVPTADVNGNFIDCYSDFPYGSLSKPIEQGRILMHLDAQNKIAHPPKLM